VEEDYCVRTKLISPTSLYVCGSYQATVDFDPGPPIDWHISNGDYDAYLGRFNSDGEVQWVRTFGGTGTDAGSFVTTDPTGLCYISGYFSNDVDFNPDPVDEDLHIANGGYDAYFSKFPSDGDW